MHTRRPANGWFGRVDTGNAFGFGQQSVCATTEYACVGGAAALAPPRLWLCLGKLMQSNDAARNSRIAERAVMPAGEPVRCTGGASCLVIGWACAAMLRNQSGRPGAWYLMAACGDGGYKVCAERQLQSASPSALEVAAAITWLGCRLVKKARYARLSGWQPNLVFTTWSAGPSRGAHTKACKWMVWSRRYGQCLWFWPAECLRYHRIRVCRRCCRAGTSASVALPGQVDAVERCSAQLTHC